jgi:hypothetical protein
MRDVIPVATLVLDEILIVALGGMLMYELVSGNIIKRNMLAKAGRRERPGGYWRAIAVPYFFLPTAAFRVLYTLSGLKR